MTFHFPSKWNHLISNNILSMHHASNGIRVDELFVSLVVSRKQTKLMHFHVILFFFFCFVEQENFFIGHTAYSQMMSFPTSNYFGLASGASKKFSA